MVASIRGGNFQGVRIGQAGGSPPYFLLDTFTGSGNMSTHTSDSGVTWSPISSVPSGYAGTNAIIQSNPSFLATAQIATSFVNGYAMVNAVVKSGSRIIAAVTGGDTASSGIFISDDNGANWTQAFALTDANTAITGFAINGSTIIAGSQQADKIYKSINNGTSWSVSTSGLYGSLASSIYVAYGNSVYVAIGSVQPGTGYVKHSTDGTTWSTVTLVSGSTFGFLEVKFKYGYFTVIEQVTGKLFRSTDGITWDWLGSVGSYIGNVGTQTFDYIPLDSTTYAMVVAQWDGSTNVIAGNTGIWTMKIGISEGATTYTHVSDVITDVFDSVATTGFTCVGVNILNGLSTSNDLLLSNGSGYTYSFLTTNTDPTNGSSNNSGYAVVPYQWCLPLQDYNTVVGHLFNPNAALFQVSFGWFECMFWDGSTFLATGSTIFQNKILIGTGSISSPSAAIPIIQTVQLSGGIAQMKSTWQGDAFMSSSLLPPVGNYYIELDINVAEGGYDFNLGIFGVNNTTNYYGYEFDVTLDSTGAVPYDALAINSAVVDNTGTPSGSNGLTTTGVAVSGSHTLRLEVTSSNSLFTVKFDGSTITSISMPSVPTASVFGIRYGSGTDASKVSISAIRGGTLP